VTAAWAWNPRSRPRRKAHGFKGAEARQRRGDHPRRPGPTYGRANLEAARPRSRPGADCEFSGRCISPSSTSGRRTRFAWGEYLRPGRVVPGSRPPARPSRIYHPGRRRAQRIEKAIRDVVRARRSRTMQSLCIKGAGSTTTSVPSGIDTTGESLHKRGHKAARRQGADAREPGGVVPPTMRL